jgi:hypothetical protein
MKQGTYNVKLFSVNEDGESPLLFQTPCVKVLKIIGAEFMLVVVLLLFFLLQNVSDNNFLGNGTRMYA